MAWGGARPGAGRKKASETATASARTSLNRRATGAPAPTAAPAQPLLPMKLPAIRDNHLAMARIPTPRPTPKTNPFEIGKPPPGVVPEGVKLAMDDAAGVPVQMGAWAGVQWGTLVAEGQTFLGYTYLSELSQRPEYRVMSETIATEMTKKWLKLKVKSEGDESKVDRVKQLEDEFDRLRVQDKFREAAEQDGLFGRSHLYLDTGATDDPQELRLPIGDGWDQISKAKVGKGDLKGLQNVEAIWTYPSNFNAINPLKPDWYKPTSWFTMATEVHASRLLTFIGREVPDLLKPSYFFGGLALTQIAKPYVDNWLRTRQSVSDLIHSFTVFVLSTDLEAMLTVGGEDFFKRLDLFNITRDNKGVMALNEGTEKLENISAPLGSLDALQAQSMEQMAAVSRIPVVKLTGIEPKGLNASSEGSIKSFDDLILAYQKRLFDRHVRRIMGFAMMNIWGEVDPDIVHEWEPLRALTAKEIAEMQKLKAETGSIYIDKGVLHPVEERQRIASDPETEYDGLDVEDVPDLAEEEEQGLEPGKGGEGGKGGTGGEGGGEGGEAGDEAVIPFAQDAEFHEEDHPRAPDGKFGAGGGGGASEAGEAKMKPVTIPKSTREFASLKDQFIEHLAHGGDERVAEVPIADIRATQDLVREAGPEEATASAPIVGIMDAAGKLHVVNGHHRIEQAKAKGQKTIKARIVDDKPAAKADRFKSDAGSPTAKRWASEGDAKGLTSTFDPKKYPDIVVYHGLAEGHERAGFGFVTRDPEGAAFHGKVQAFRIKPGSKIYADMEEGRGKTGEQTLLTSKANASSGIVHFEDLEPIKSGAGAQDAEWKESDHPRAPDGKFGSGGGGGKAKGVKAAKGPEVNPTGMHLLKNSQKGSNPGGVYSDPETDEEYYVKHLKTTAHKTNEYTAAGLYQLAGVNTLDYVPTANAKDVATKYTKLDASKVAQLTSKERKEAQKDFAIHAWLANYDAVGTGGDNIGVVNGQKGPAVLDVGGSLDFRAQGAPKGDAFGTDVTELKTMLDPEKAPDASKFYGDMTASEKKASVERVADIRDDDIRATVKENGGTPELAEKLIARKFNMAKEFGLQVIEEKEDPEFAKNHPRGPDGRFIKGAGGEKPKELEAGSGEFKSKKEHAAHLLQKGVTTKNMLKALGWPSISMPAMAKSLGMKLEKTKQGGETVYKGTPMTAEEKAQAQNDIDAAVQAKLQAAKGEADIQITSYGHFAQMIESPHLPTKTKESIKSAYPAWAKEYENETSEAPPTAPAAPKLPPATPAELEKAKKTTPVQQQYVKDWPTTAGGKKASEKILADFNEKYSGKEVTGTALQQKVADFKKMQANISAINEGEKSVAAKQQAEANAQAAEELKKAQAAAKATTKQYMQELGISETEATGFEALVKMQGGKAEDVIASFKKYQEAAKNHGYPITGFQYALIRNYIDGGYTSVNAALRSGSMSAAQHVYAKLVNNAIDKMPKYAGTVNRGTHLEAKDIAKYKVGHVVREHAFTSTGKGFSFSGNVKYNIKSIGKRGADFSGGANLNESEVLFKAGTFFLVHKVETKGGTTYVDMEEVEGHD